MKTRRLKLPESDRRELASWFDRRDVDARSARRARVVLMSADGAGFNEIRARLNCDVRFVQRWRQRFEDHGIGGLAPRREGSRPWKVTADVEARILEWTTNRTPADGSGQWSCRKLAAELGDVSHSTVQRVWSRHRIEPAPLDPDRVHPDRRAQAGECRSIATRGNTRLASSSDRILAAAITAYSARGSDVTMLEVATRAGVTRRTLYRLYPDRRALVEAVALHRLDQILLRVQPRIAARPHFDDALVTGFVEFISEARADPVFIAALDEASEWQLERFLVGSNPKFFDRADTLWRAAMSRAAEAHEWRPGLDMSKVNSWLRSVAVILLLRDDLDRHGQEDLVRNFVVPALVAPGRWR